MRYSLRKSVGIQSYSGPYSVRMRKNTDQNNSEYGHFSVSDFFPPTGTQNTNFDGSKEIALMTMLLTLFWYLYYLLYVYYLRCS